MSAGQTNKYFKCGQKVAANENVFVNLGENLDDIVFVNDSYCLTSSKKMNLLLYKINMDVSFGQM